MAERVNESQIKCIVGYMRNKNALRVICAGPKSEDVFKIKWAQLVKELNFLGPPVKTVIQWQKVWRYLRNIAIMKTIRNRSRVATKKISSLTPQSMISGIGAQDGFSTVEKGQFSVHNDSDATNCYLPVSNTVQTNDHEISRESSCSDSPVPAPSLVGRKSKRAVEELRKMARSGFLQKENKSVFRKSINSLQSISFSFNTLSEYS